MNSGKRANKQFIRLLTFMRKASFFAVLAVPVFRAIGGKPFLTRCCSGFATLTAELIRWAS